MTNTDPREAESLDEYVWRLGSLKKSGKLEVKWDDIASMANEAFSVSFDESPYRKRFKFMEALMTPPADITQFSGEVVHNLQSFQRTRQQLRDERSAYRRAMAEDARLSTFCELLLEAVNKAEPVEYKAEETPDTQKAVYAMLSDIHYGMEFHNSAGEYSPDIAKKRVMEYAEYIISLGIKEDTDTCYVSLMGDLISGQIHSSIRVENKENVISQIIGVSELVVAFLRRLSEAYKFVYVNSVDGNHSRLEANLQDDIRNERLDALVIWYCRTALANVEQVHFEANTLDSSIGLFEIFDRSYISVHGDLDKDYKDSVHKIHDLYDKRIDYFLAAHMHVPTMRLENTAFIQNGAVISGGDDYTMRNRLFAKPQQVCLVVTPEGVESIHSVRLH